MTSRRRPLRWSLTLVALAAALAGVVVARPAAVVRPVEHTAARVPHVAVDLGHNAHRALVGVRTQPPRVLPLAPLAALVAAFVLVVIAAGLVSFRGGAARTVRTAAIRAPPLRQ